MKLIKKLILTIILTTLFAFSSITNVNAASATISVSSSKSQVVVGKTFSVTIKVSSSGGIGAWEYTPTYDKSVLKLVSGETPVVGYAQNSGLKSAKNTYTFKAIGKGSSKISVKSYSVLNWGESKLSVSVSSKTVKVITQSELEATYSKDNNLKSLSVDGFSLSPSFSKDKTSYTVEAGPNTTEVKIKAQANDSSADISGSGTFNVSEGENKFNITVTAENGSKKTYTVIVNVSDPNPIKTTIDNTEYLVVKRKSNLQSVEGFTDSEVKIDDQVVPALFSEINNIKLVGLRNSEGTTKLFVYDEKNNSYTEYKELKLEQIKLYPLSISQEFNKEYTLSSVTINDIEFQCLKQNNSDFVIIHAKNMADGKDNYFTLDTKLKTVIRYNEDDNSTYENKIKNQQNIIMLLGAETAIIIFILISILIAKVRKNNKRKKKIQEELLRRQEEERLELERIELERLEEEQRKKENEEKKPKKRTTSKSSSKKSQNKKKDEVIKENE